MLAYATSDRNRMGSYRTGRLGSGSGYDPKERFLIDFTMQRFMNRSSERAVKWPIAEWVPYLLRHASEIAGTASSLFEWLMPIATNESSQVAQETLASPAELLDQVRNTFNLNMSDAADILHITRPTLYRWTTLRGINGMDEIRFHESRNRLMQLHRIATTWNAKGRIPGRWLNTPLPDDRTMLNLLKADPLDEDTLCKAHETLFARKQDLRKGEHQRAKETINVLKDAFAALDAQVPPPRR